MNTNFRKKFLILCILGSLLIVWLCSANHVVTYFFIPIDNQAKKGDISQFPEKDEVVIAIKEETNLSDTWDSYRIAGGAFCETQEAHQYRKIQLVLKSDRTTYIIPATSSIRVDVFYEFEGIKKMPDGSVGFESEFSTLNITAGTYELYIYVWENENAYGITNSGHIYIKDSQGFKKYE